MFLWVFLRASSCLCANSSLVSFLVITFSSPSSPPLPLCSLSHAALGRTDSEISLLKLTCGPCASTAMSGCQMSWNAAWPAASATAKSARKSPPSLCRSACSLRAGRCPPLSVGAVCRCVCWQCFSRRGQCVAQRHTFILTATNESCAFYSPQRCTLNANIVWRRSWLKGCLHHSWTSFPS